MRPIVLTAISQLHNRDSLSGFPSHNQARYAMSSLQRALEQTLSKLCELCVQTCERMVSVGKTDVSLYACVRLFDMLQSDRMKHEETDNGTVNLQNYATVSVCLIVCVHESSCDCCKWVAGGSLYCGKHLRRDCFFFFIT